MTISNPDSGLLDKPSTSSRTSTGEVTKPSKFSKVTSFSCMSASWCSPLNTVSKSDPFLLPCSREAELYRKSSSIHHATGRYLASICSASSVESRGPSRVKLDNAHCAVDASELWKSNVSAGRFLIASSALSLSWLGTSPDKTKGSSPLANIRRANLSK